MPELTPVSDRNAYPWPHLNGVGRGQGWRYTGSLEALRGWWVVSLDNCTCSPECYPDPDQPWLATRATALLAPDTDPHSRDAWQRVSCARFTSFSRP